MNSVNITGRLTADPELRATKDGSPVGSLRVAIQRRRGAEGEDRGAEFVDVTVFGSQAEVCASYLAKGRKVAIEGRLHHSEWQAEDGSRRQKLEVTANSVEFLDRKPSEHDVAEPVEAAV